MYGYVYKTTNLINNKIYIGQKKSEIFLENKYLGSGKILKQAINKYGSENFKVELIEECLNFDELNEREKYWIDKYNSRNSDIGYNIAQGGSNLNEYTRKKMSNYHYDCSGENHPMFGKHHSEETKKKLSNALKGNSNFRGKHFNEESRKKLSESMKGRTAWNKGMKGYLSEEHKKAFSRLGYNHSEETLKKISKSMKGRKYINNGTINKKVKPEELDFYLSNGWKLGQIKKEQRLSKA